MEPLSNFPEAPTKVYSVYAQDLPRKSLETFLYRITYNGHFWPEKWLKRELCRLPMTGIIHRTDTFQKKTSCG